MRFEKLMSLNPSENKTVTIQKGVYNGIMIMFPRDSYDFTLESVTADLTVKVRSQSKTQLVCNKMPIQDLAAISHLKNGFDSVDTLATQMMSSYGLVADAGTDLILKKIAEKSAPYDLIFLPIGQVTLGLENELEVEFQNTGGLNLPTQVYAIQTNPSAEVLITYDRTVDRDIMQKGISEVILVSNFISSSAGNITFDSREVLIETDSLTNQLDEFSIPAYSHLMNSLQYSENNAHTVFRSSSPMGETVRAKNLSLSSEDYFILIKPQILPTVANGTIQALEDAKVSVRQMTKEERIKAEKAGVVSGNSREIDYMIDQIKREEKL
ncbi:hypothetical protein MY04_1119 [Flammeovirga sp. MY04]|uniref:hypothetical protein n=1 Tax=Flammeovirga sp. MY04 TaxID=1191459 RepID=UPI0008258B01|nr:hypothetical protein [Flammeovirga sp. MY04]ANQ48496.2 hypothetical protein MY04_1119 [Flammeovirga sp. MY04]